MTKITRPKEGRMLGGVCAGIARSVDLDVTLVRIAAAALVLFAGAGPLIYLVAWAIIPNEEDGSSFATEAAEQARTSWNSRKHGHTDPAAPGDQSGSGDTFNPYTEE
ncbi:PspC domain-containing protein [Acidipropionibacterium jensenii]|uniref:PspC domain-containing protein n=1 Tax=Acidipropionibacterium jensenii TaxID=1749 RepID=UPI00214AFE32|nr:PspC domain-containing protein [Acidipropionibacterium jensenii]